MHFWPILVIDLKSKKRSDKETVIGANGSSFGLKLNGDANLIPFDLITRTLGQEQSEGWIPQNFYCTTLIEKEQLG